MTLNDLSDLDVVRLGGRLLENDDVLGDGGDCNATASRLVQLPDLGRVRVDVNTSVLADREIRADIRAWVHSFSGFHRDTLRLEDLIRRRGPALPGAEPSLRGQLDDALVELAELARKVRGHLKHVVVALQVLEGLVEDRTSSRSSSQVDLAEKKGAPLSADLRRERKRNRITRILMLAADPDQAGMTRSFVNKEHDAIRSGIGRGCYRDDISFEAVMSATPDGGVTSALTKHRPHILHIAGHGDKTTVMLSSPTGGAFVLDHEALAQVILAATTDVRLVVLTVCYSEELARVIQNDLKAVIALRGTMNPFSAIKFSEHFYEALASGIAVGPAFRMARAALCEAKMPDADVPQLLPPENPSHEALFLSGPNESTAS